MSTPDPRRGGQVLYRSEETPFGDGRWWHLGWSFASRGRLVRDIPLSRQRGTLALPRPVAEALVDDLRAGGHCIISCEPVGAGSAVVVELGRDALHALAERPAGVDGHLADGQVWIGGRWYPVEGLPVAIHDVLCGWRIATDQKEAGAPGLLVCAGCGLGYRADDVKGYTLASTPDVGQPEDEKGTQIVRTLTAASGAISVQPMSGPAGIPTVDRSGFDVLADMLTRAGDDWAAEAARLPHVRILARDDEVRRDAVEVEGVALLFRAEAAPHGDGRWHVLDWGYAPLAQLSREVPLSEQQRQGGRS